jgi:tetrathionate reductase subunit B
VEKCTLCVDLIDRGGEPACVSTCGGGALCFGDLNDPKSKITERIKTSSRTQIYTLAPPKEEDPGPCVTYGE